MSFRFKIYHLIVVAVCFIAVFSCNKYNTQDCIPSDNCYTIPIDSGDVIINLTYSSGPGVPVILYEGYVEDNNIIWADTVYQNELIFYLPIKKRYAVQAFYQVGGQVTVALDGKKLKEDSYIDCGETCYRLAELELDVKKL